jgi:ribosomal protein L21E
VEIMEVIIRNKLMPLGILAVIGIGMVAVAYATGTAEQLPISFQANVTTAIDEGNRTLNLILEGEVLQSFKLPEGVTGVKFLSADNGGISLKYITKKQLNNQSGQSKEMLINKTIRIAESDKRVKELVNGKDYSTLLRRIFQGEEGVVAEVVIVVENKKYEVTVDVNNEKVVNIEEAKKFNNSFYIINVSSCTGGYDGDGTNENGCSR